MAGSSKASAGKSSGKSAHCTFQVLWQSSRDRFEVHGDDGELHGFSRDQHTAIAIAQRQAAQAERDGRKATICVEQPDGYLKVAPNF